jgi:hypothetical protein
MTSARFPRSLGLWPRWRLCRSGWGDSTGSAATGRAAPTHRVGRPGRGRGTPPAGTAGAVSGTGGQASGGRTGSAARIPGGAGAVPAAPVQRTSGFRWRGRFDPRGAGAGSGGASGDAGEAGVVWGSVAALAPAVRGRKLRHRRQRGGEVPAGSWRACERLHRPMAENADDRQLVGHERSSHVDQTQDHERQMSRGTSSTFRRLRSHAPVCLIFSWHRAYSSTRAMRMAYIPLMMVELRRKNYAYFGLHRGRPRRIPPSS